MSELKPCPFCGGKARISFLQTAFAGINGFGDKEIKYRVQIICNKCHSRGKPITTDWMINPYPWQSSWNQKYKKYDKNQEETERFRPYVEQAIEAWNTRAESMANVEIIDKPIEGTSQMITVTSCTKCENVVSIFDDYCSHCGSRLVWNE